MKILITGAAGTIGQVLMRGLSQKYEVIGIDKKEGPSVIVADILKDSERIKDLLKGADVVVHLAWNIGEGGASFNPPLIELHKFRYI